MRLQCKKLTFDEAQDLKVDDWIIVIDKNNEIFRGKVYFVRITDFLYVSITISGFRICEDDECELITGRHLSLNSYQNFKYLDVYKLKNTNIAVNFLKKSFYITNLLNYNFFEKYIEVET